MTFLQSILIVSFVLAFSPPFAYMTVKFGAAGYFRAKEMHQQRQKQSH